MLAQLVTAANAGSLDADALAAGGGHLDGDLLAEAAGGDAAGAQSVPAKSSAAQGQDDFWGNLFELPTAGSPMNSAPPSPPGTPQQGVPPPATGPGNDLFSMLDFNAAVSTAVAGVPEGIASSNSNTVTSSMLVTNTRASSADTRQSGAAWMRLWLARSSSISDPTSFPPISLSSPNTLYIYYSGHVRHRHCHHHRR